MPPCLCVKINHHVQKAATAAALTAAALAALAAALAALSQPADDATTHDHRDPHGWRCEGDCEPGTCEHCDSDAIPATLIR